MFDLLAMLEDGFTQLQNVKTSTLDSSAQTDSYGGSMGVSELVAFLKVSLKADKRKEKNTQAQQEATAEKVHTPNSLFFKLRTLLDTESLIKRVKTVEDVEQLQSGQIVEFKALLKKTLCLITLRH